MYQFYKYNTYVHKALNSRIKLTPTDIAKITLVGPQLEHFYRMGISNNELLFRLGPVYNNIEFIKFYKYP